MRRISALSAALVALASGSCVHPHRLAAIESPPACRSAITRSGSPAALEWILATHADRIELDEWCRTVGPAIVDAAAAPATPPRLDDLIVVSWNVEVGGGDVDALLDRFGAPGRPIVLLLQEAYRSGSAVPSLRADVEVPGRIAPTSRLGVRRSIEEIAVRRGLSLVYVPSMRNGHGDHAEDRGNAILSTLPLAGPIAIELPFEHQRRVAVAANVTIADANGLPSPLRLVSAHLDARASWRHGLLLWFGRARQAAALVEAIHRDHVATILGGDFNSWLGDVEPEVRATRQF